MPIKETAFGNGYTRITLENKQGVKLSVSDYGARVVDLLVPLSGEERNIILGFDQAQDYQEKDPYIGATIGRTAGRIRDGKFELSGKQYQVAIDPETGYSLHGGSPGFEEKKWNYQTIEGSNEVSVIFYRTSPDGENDFPGNLDVEVRYTLTNDNVWRVRTRGISDQDTLFNPTNHVYFNLSGDVSVPIDDHSLWINARQYATLTDNMLPTGEVVPVMDTPFDFREPKKLAETFADKEFSQKVLVDGIDHPFFLKDHGLDRAAASLISPDEKVQVTVRTTASSVVVFTANFGEDTPEMRGKKLAHHGGITFETQEAPGAERFESFGDIQLPANQIKEFTTEFKIEQFN